MKKHILLYFSIIFALFSTPSFTQSKQYRIFVDAGSTGSRLHIFQYNHAMALPKIHDVFSESTTPGLSSYAADPKAAGASLKKLLDDAVFFLDKHAAIPAQTPVDIMATAGMRLLSEEKQQSIYAAVRQYMQTHYDFPINGIETISGEQEGLYGWLDVNYLLGNFQDNKPTIGSLDMGGASTQIVFEVADGKNSTSIPITLNQHRYAVFSKSFLNLGQDQALHRMATHSTADACFPQNYAYQGAKIGHFNFLACASIYQNIIKKHQLSEQIPSVEGRSFIAFSGIYYAFNFLAADASPDQGFLENQIQMICAKDWAQLKKDYPKAPDKYLSNYCAHAIYQDQLIYGTYKIQGHQLTVANKIKKTGLDWTLGAALFELVQQDASDFKIKRQVQA
ncbi:MAG: hypothetical protein NXI01_06880 [Gammaproteobacteria bacterium]|nr:hypothetical protein [Gammaproteobacteria bacterium]